VQVHPATAAASSVVPNTPTAPVPTVAQEASSTPPAGQETIPASSDLCPALADAAPSGQPLQTPEESASSARPKAKPSLIKAVKDKNLALIDELLRGGCALEDLGMWDNTPLLAACNYGHAEAALRLIAAGANVCARNEHNATPLHYAAVEGSLPVVAALLEACRSQADD
ncbi:unnamed protein product, partial [Polarella glacialis]